MSCKHTLVILALALATGTATADFKQQVAPARRSASVGDVAVGQVAVETDDRLELNIQPCSGTPAVIVFRKPYLKEAVQAVQCNGAAKPQVQVIQK